MKKVLIVTSVVVGILLILQIRSFQKVEFLVQRSGPESVLQEMRVFQLANQQLRERIVEEEKKVVEINSEISSQTLEEEINRLRVLAGEVEVTGEGLTISISAPVKDFWISDLIAQLVSAGAEAVAINNIRLTSETAGFRDIGDGLVVRRHFIKPPFNISVIGPKNELKNSVAQNGGIMDRIKDAYPKTSVSLTLSDKISIPSLINLPE